MATNDMSVAIGSVGEFEDDALKHSKDFVHHLWARDFSWCLNRIVKDFAWIGPNHEQIVQTRQDFGDILSERPGLFPRSSVTDEEYTVATSNESLCVTSGTYQVLTPTDNQHIDVQRYRCTFVWKRTGRKLALVHMHVSIPAGLDDQVKGEPVVAGTEAYRYMKSLMRMGSSRKNVSLYDVDGTLHWVHPSQIIYLEASRKRTVVHCMTKDIVVPAVIRDAIEMVDGKIIRVHRSYAVNRDHVIELKGGHLLLDDGTSIAIPVKRLADVRAGLTVN